VCVCGFILQFLNQVLKDFVYSWYRYVHYMSQIINISYDDINISINCIIYKKYCGKST